MLITVWTILLIVAFVLCLLAAFSVTVPRINLIGAGLACYFLALLVSHFMP